MAVDRFIVASKKHIRMKRILVIYLLMSQVTVGQQRYSQNGSLIIIGGGAIPDTINAIRMC
jgi:hypothetical protein